MPTIRHPKDFFAGLLFVAVGVAAIIISSGYTLGTAAHMGPGYFPRMLGILLAAIGAVLSLRSLRLRGESLPAWKWRPTVVVLGSVVLFGAIVTPLNLDEPATYVGLPGVVGNVSTKSSRIVSPMPLLVAMSAKVTGPLVMLKRPASTPLK